MSLGNILIGAHALDNSWDTDGSPIHSEYDVSISDLMDLTVSAGGQIVRVPMDLSTSGPNGAESWQVDLYIEILQTAAAIGIKVIFEPGQTPADLSSDGSVAGVPDNQEDIELLAQRFGDLVSDVYAKAIETDPVLIDSIAGWEIGNEPNLTYNYNGDPIDENNLEDVRFYSVSAENGKLYADYLHATNEVINALNIVNNGQAVDINVIGAGIAHNDQAYFNAMFERLDELDAEIDGFSLHPYTTNEVDDFGNQTAPESGRATDWVIQPTDYSESWDTYYSFQGALNSMQQAMNLYGFGSADLWITEFGVPSYLGYRNAGVDGVIDQARWIAEALGVLDSWDNTNLKGIVLHQILDDVSYEYSQTFNAYDLDPDNDGTWFDGEGSFGIFHEYNGEITAKPVAQLMHDLVDGNDYQYLNIESNYTNSTFDYSTAGQSTGLLTGVIALTHDGADSIIGSNYNDSIFAGEGNDIVDGGMGDDRLYGGAGDDLFIGGQGADIFVGNTNGLSGDTVSYNSSDLGVTVDLNNILTQQGDAEGDLFDGIENIIGSNFDDIIRGDSSDNIFNGNDGNDILNGGSGGNNTFTGGSGNDIFAYDNTNTNSTIMDFEDGVDKIDISSIVANTGLFSFSLGASTGSDGNLNIKKVSCFGLYELEYGELQISAEQVEDDTVVSIVTTTDASELSSIVLKDFSVEDLGYSDFIF